MKATGSHMSGCAGSIPGLGSLRSTQACVRVCLKSQEEEEMEENGLRPDCAPGVAFPSPTTSLVFLQKRTGSLAKTKREDKTGKAVCGF